MRDARTSGDGRVCAETGCSTVRGPVSVEDRLLVSTGPLMSTRMACEPALMEQERWITEMLGARPRLELSGPYLYLHRGEGEQWWLGLETANETLPASHLLRISHNYRGRERRLRVGESQ